MHLIHIGRAPRYMADSVQSIVESSRRSGLRSADTADYVKHRLQSKFGERCFSYAGPAAWNSLPHSIKLITDTSIFKQLLKSHLFRIAFWHFVSTPGQFCKPRSTSLNLCVFVSTQPSALCGTVNEYQFSGWTIIINGDTIAAYRHNHSPSQVAWSDGRQPLGAVLH